MHKCVLFQSLLDQSGYTDVDYLSIDVEGAELDALKGINFQKTKFKLISIENNFPNDDRVQRFLTAQGYKLYRPEP